MIIPLASCHVEEVASLHFDILGWSINSRLGKQHLLDLYGQLINDQYTFGYVDLDEHDALLSVLTITTEPAKTRSKILKIFSFQTFFQLMLQCLSKPADFIDLLENKFRLPSLLNEINAKSELLTWVSDTKSLRGRVSGVRIMNHGVAELKKRNLLPSVAQVARYDPIPNNFHKSAGNRLVYSLMRNNLYLVG